MTPKHIGKHRGRLASSALAAALAIVPLAGAQAQDEPIDLSGTSVTIGTAQAQVLNVGVIRMIDLLREWGADVDRVELPSISGLEAIVADRIEIASRSSDEVIIGNSRDVDVRAFATPVSTMHYAVVSAPGIDEIADLEGQNIGTSGPGGFNSTLFRYMLEREDLDPDQDAQLVPIGGSSERAAALMAGQVQAVIVYIDNWIAMREEGADVQLLGYIADLIPGLSPRAIFARESYLQENEELATAIACANLETNAWMHESKDEYVQFTLDNVTGATEETVSAFYDVGMEINMFPTDAAEILDPDGYQALADLLHDAGDIDSEVSGEEIVDQSYLQAAAEMGCGAGQG